MDTTRKVMRAILNEGLVSEPLDEDAKEWLKALAIGGLLAVGGMGAIGKLPGQAKAAQVQPEQSQDFLRRTLGTEAHSFFLAWLDAMSDNIVDTVVLGGEAGVSPEEVEFFREDIKELIDQQVGPGVLSPEDEAAAVETLFGLLDHLVRQKAEKANLEGELAPILKQMTTPTKKAPEKKRRRLRRGKA